MILATGPILSALDINLVQHPGDTHSLYVILDLLTRKVIHGREMSRDQTRDIASADGSRSVALYGIPAKVVVQHPVDFPSVAVVP